MSACSHDWRLIKESAIQVWRKPFWRQTVERRWYCTKCRAVETTVVGLRDRGAPEEWEFDRCGYCECVAPAACQAAA